jgi:hypothetical protein
MQMFYHAEATATPGIVINRIRGRICA